MSIDKITHEAYMEALKTESEKILARVKKDAEASLAKTANQQALKAYEIILSELLKMPEGIKKKIQEAQETFWPEGFDNIDLLNKKLWYIKDSIDRDISLANVHLSMIRLAQQNGANVSEMLESIKNSSALIKSECEKLF